MSSLKDVLGTVARVFPYLDRETQQRVLALIREYKPKFAAMEAGGMPASAVQAMADAVPDKLVSEIVNDLRSGPGQPGWIKREPQREVQRGSGWQSPPKPEDRSRQFAMFDAMVAHMVGGPNEPVK